jgi:hypothetical protein
VQTANTPQRPRKLSQIFKFSFFSIFTVTNAVAAGAGVLRQLAARRRVNAYFVWRRGEESGADLKGKSNDF